MRSRAPSSRSTSTPPNSSRAGCGARVSFKRVKKPFTSLLRPLRVYQAVVEAIAHAPTTSLSPALLQQLPRALEACQVAITLRERVTQFWTRIGMADHAHAHFLDRMKAWLGTLRPLMESEAIKKQAKKTKKTESVATTRFTNYYEVLQLPEDYFMEDPVAEENEPPNTTAPLPQVSTVTRNKQLDEVFQEDLELELVGFLMELEDTVEQVYQIYADVKREKCTLLEATVTVYTATRLVESRVAERQVWYPSIHEAQDVIVLLERRMSKKLDYKMADTLARVITDESDTYHIPGFLFDGVPVGAVGVAHIHVGDPEQSGEIAPPS